MTEFAWIRKGLLLLLLAGVFLSVCGCEKKQAGVKVGEASPEFSLPDLSGREISVPRSLKGKVVIIRFWADWCVYCSVEMPVLDDVYKRYRERGVVVVAVNVGQPRDVAEAFVKGIRISYPVLLDTYSVTAKQFGVVGLPTTFILDRQGIVRKKILGEADRGEFERMVKEIL